MIIKPFKSFTTALLKSRELSGKIISDSYVHACLIVAFCYKKDVTKNSKSNITTKVTLKSVKCSKSTQCGKQAIYNVLKIIFDFNFHFWIFK